VLVEIMAARRAPRRRVERAGFIEVEFGCGARVCIRGEVSSSSCCDDRLAGGAPIWLAAGMSDMRKGFDSLALQAQSV